MAEQAGGPTTVLVIGTGAIGSLYGAMLARGGAQVSVVCRSDHEQVAREGIRVSSWSWGDFTFRPARVLRSAAEATQPPDYLFVALKSVRGVDRVAILQPAVGPRTVIVLVGNGIGIEDEIARAFPHNELLSMLAFVAASRTGPAAVRHHALGKLAMGRYPSGITPAAQRLAGLFQQAGVACELHEDIAAARWLKNLWNVAFNPISVLGGGMDTRTILAPEEGRAFVRRVMREAAAVSAAHGYPIGDSVIDEAIRSTAAMTPYKTSMAVDFLAGRPMEVEPILGAVVRGARQHAVPVPSLEALYALLCMVQAGPQAASS